MTRLKELRIEKGLSQINVGIKIGIDQSEYSRIEKGRRNFTADQGVRLALLFDTSIDYLMGLTDNRKPYERSEKYKNVGEFDIRDV